MFARTRDLYFEVRASCFGLLFEGLPGLFDFLVLPLDFLVLVGQEPGLFLEPRGLLCNSLLAAAQLHGEGLGPSSRSFGPHVGLDRV